MSQTRVINGPHIRTERTTRSVMMNVSISLVPALLGAIYFWYQGFISGRAFHYGMCSYRIFPGEINEKTGNSRRFQCCGYRTFANCRHAGYSSHMRPWWQQMYSVFWL